MQPQPSDSIREEFMDAQLADRRLLRIAEDLAQDPQGSLPQASGDGGQTAAAYRFFNNDRIAAAEILAAHQARTRQRVAERPVVRAVSDTTSLNFADRPDTSGLGPISTSAEKMFGLWYHTDWAFSPDGLPLGLVHSQGWARDPKQFGCRSQRHQRAIEQKESAKWLRSLAAVQALAAQTPQTRWVMIADREADLYELFEKTAMPPANVARLIRAHHNRNLVETKRPLFTHVAHLRPAAEVELQLPRRRGQKARPARVEIRWGEVRLRAPDGKGQQRQLRLWVLEAREPRRSKHQTPMLWRRLSTAAIGTLAEALERLRWYCLRWGIEVFHRVLKSGCEVEAVQRQTAARLQRYVAVKLVIAWQVMALAQWGRQAPQRALNELLEEVECRVLRAVERDRQKRSRAGIKRLPTKPTVHDGLWWVGRLGGHLGRRGDGLPGPLRLTRGIERLHYITLGWKIAPVANNGVYR